MRLIDRPVSKIGYLLVVKRIVSADRKGERNFLVESSRRNRKAGSRKQERTSVCTTTGYMAVAYPQGVAVGTESMKYLSLLQLELEQSHTYMYFQVYTLKYFATS